MSSPQQTSLQQAAVQWRQPGAGSAVAAPPGMASARAPGRGQQGLAGGVQRGRDGGHPALVAEQLTAQSQSPARKQRETVRQGGGGGRRERGDERRRRGLPIGQVARRSASLTAPAACPAACPAASGLLKAAAGSPMAWDGIAACRPHVGSSAGSPLFLRHSGRLQPAACPCHSCTAQHRPPTQHTHSAMVPGVGVREAELGGGPGLSGRCWAGAHATRLHARPLSALRPLFDAPRSLQATYTPPAARQGPLCQKPPPPPLPTSFSRGTPCWLGHSSHVLAAAATAGFSRL